MFWKGRVNAVLVIITIAGFCLFFAAEGFSAAAGFFIFMLLVRLFLGVLNIIWTAITGNPLFYDTKILRNRDE